MSNQPKQSKARKHKLKAGMKFGQLTLMQRLRDDSKTKSPNLKVQWKVKCACGTEPFTCKQYFLTRIAPEPKRHCGGDAHRTISAIYNQEFRCYSMMHLRCEDPNHIAYRHYNKRGIKIHPSFHKSLPDLQGFKAWLKEMGPRPSKLYSTDRIDNTRGYEPGNIRWATATQQRQNQGDTIDGIPIKRPDPAS